MSQSEGMASEELAKFTNCAARYVREWLYGVTLAGYLEFDKTSRKESLNSDQKLLFVTEGFRFAQHDAFIVSKQRNATLYAIKRRIQARRWTGF